MNISREQFNNAYEKLPFPIREYLAGGEIGIVVREVGAKYRLHIDTIGAIDREVINMLLGFENPQQFVGELKSVGVPQENIASIVQEFNERVFIPLHQKMQQSGPEQEDDDEMYNEIAADFGVYNGVTASMTIAAPAVSQYTAPVSPAAPIYSAPSLESVPPSISQYAANAAFPATFAPPPQPQAIPAQQPLAPVPQPSVSSFPQPTPAVASQSPQNFPVQPSPVATPQVFTPAPAQAPTNTNRDALHDILKQYGVDPYRESPE
jgi:hypothetical protein